MGFTVRNVVGRRQKRSRDVAPENSRATYEAPDVGLPYGFMPMTLPTSTPQTLPTSSFSWTGISYSRPSSVSSANASVGSASPDNSPVTRAHELPVHSQQRRHPPTHHYTRPSPEPSQATHARHHSSRRPEPRIRSDNLQCPGAPRMRTIPLPDVDESPHERDYSTSSRTRHHGGKHPI